MKIRKIWMVVIILLLMVNIFPATQAAPKAIIYEMDVKASPAVQGRRLPIDITCDVGWGGACCYTVYAHDVEAEIILPENITLISGNKAQTISSSGQSSGTVAVEAGGGLTWLKPKWGVMAEDYGEYNVTVQITGRNELGENIDESRNASITIVSGAAISKPIIPGSLNVNEDITIVAEVSSPDADVEEVTLFYSKNLENWVQNPMENTEGDVWVGIIPGQKSEGEIYYYMESLDEEGKTFTTETYSLQVENVDKIGAITVLATYGTLVAFVLGIFLILYIDRRGKRFFSRKGMSILGASLKLSALRGLDEIQDDQERLRKLRTRIALILLIIAIVLLVIAIATGQLQDVISHTTNPTEA